MKAPWMSATRTLYLLLASLFLAVASPAPAGAARLSLTWTINSNNENGFAIERREEPGAYTVLSTIGAAQNSYMDITVATGTTYCYRVRAFNAAGYSGYTNEACAVSVETDDAIDLFVTRLYTKVLGRAPDPEGFQAWTAFLRGHCDLDGFQQIGATFFDSDEFRSRPLVLKELIRKLYLTFLGREPDPSGWAMWTNVLRQARLGIAVDGFVPSSEFRALLPDPTNRAAVAVLVTRFYNDILGRAPDQDGLNAWVDSVVSTRSFDELAAGFLTSTEFEARPQTFRDYIKTLYRTFLDRRPDPDGLASWEAVLRTTLLQMIDEGFVPSPEFQGLAASICG